MEFAITMHSNNFFGFSKEGDKLISGQFLDEYLPNITEVDQYVDDIDFEQRIDTFISEVNNYRPSSHIPKDRRNYEMYARDSLKRLVESEAGKDGYETQRGHFYTHEVRLYKNDNIIGRTGEFSPKPSGYLREIIYKNVIQDLRGGAGVSKISISIGYHNAGEIFSNEVSYFYHDSPRKEESQSSDYYLKFCSQFIPFLNSIECSANKESYESFGPGEEYTNDEAIGLPRYIG